MQKPVEVESALPPAPSTGLFIATGRRKTAVARVRVTPGSGKITVNGRPYEEYFKLEMTRGVVLDALNVTKTTKTLDVTASIAGGGPHGQADAARLGIARALVKADARFEPVLREHRFLTRDSRKVERKKYGRAGARRRFQFSKR